MLCIHPNHEPEYHITKNRKSYELVLLFGVGEIYILKDYHMLPHDIISFIMNPASIILVPFRKESKKGKHLLKRQYTLTYFR